MYRINDRVTIIRLGFRLFHALLILGSAFLLYSALGLDDDERVVGGTLNMFYLHRYVGLVWGFIIIAYGAYTVLSRRRVGILEPLGKPIIIQIREAFSVIGRYFFGREVPQHVRNNMGRHNVMASYAFLLLVLGLLLLGFGGIGLIISGGETSSRDLYLGAHLLGAGLLALFVLAHFFAVINKENRPLLSAVFTNGKVKREWIEGSMPKYSEERFGR